MPIRETNAKVARTNNTYNKISLAWNTHKLNIEQSKMFLYNIQTSNIDYYI